jgi:hypothetical protein
VTSPRPKPVHMADLVNAHGEVSPLCADVPRAIDLRRETWTLQRTATTCESCLLALAEQLLEREAQPPTAS